MVCCMVRTCVAYRYCVEKKIVPARLLGPLSLYDRYKTWPAPCAVTSCRAGRPRRPRALVRARAACPSRALRTHRLSGRA